MFSDSSYVLNIPIIDPHMPTYLFCSGMSIGTEHKRGAVLTKKNMHFVTLKDLLWGIVSERSIPEFPERDYPEIFNLSKPLNFVYIKLTGSYLLVERTHCQK